MSSLLPVRHMILAFLLCGCLSAAEPPELWIDVPYVKQDLEGCGAASIAMVMQYWSSQDGRSSGQQADAAYILHTLHSPTAHGIYASSMSQYFQQQGFRTFTFAADWDMLQQHLSKGRPLIVALKPSTIYRGLHYVVVVGIDSPKSIVLVNDPAERKLMKLDRAAFETQWGGAQRWTLLALPQHPAR